MAMSGSPTPVSCRVVGSAASRNLTLLRALAQSVAPERPPKFSPSYAGAFALDAPAAPAVYKVTLSAGAWIDVVQDGKFLKPIAFSEATGCANARKSVKFRLAAAPTTLQLTGVGDPDISIVVSPE